MINGITELHIMKTDILSDFDEIKVATKYFVNNSMTTQVPYDLSEIDSIEYESFPSWDSAELSSSKSVFDLPPICLNYVKFIEKYLNIPIKIISVGPDRNQTIKKD